MLETIQEYAPIKRGIFLVSSLIARYHAPAPGAEEESPPQNDDVIDSQAEIADENPKNEGESIELNGTVVSDTRQDSSESEAETKFIGDEVQPLQRRCESETTMLLSTTAPNYSAVKSTNDSNSHPLAHSDACYLNENSIQENTSVYVAGEAELPGGSCECYNSRYNASKMKNKKYLSSLSRDDSDFFDDSECDPKELQNRRFRIFNDNKDFKFTSRSFRFSVFSRKKKRTKHAKKRGNTLTDYGLPVHQCECAKDSPDLCVMHMKSQSESDASSSIFRLNDEYFADASDVSLKSYSLADDDSGTSSYVDIDVYRVRNSVADSISSTGSDRSLQLSSDWSEILNDSSASSGEPSVAEECRESDIPDTASDFSHDSRISIRPARKQRRPKKVHLLGHNVNESFMENECCHCIVM